jgi:5-methylthioadenosine/S-adenosylhomocysteine deaminase
MGSDGASSSAINLFESGRLLKSATQARYGLPINDATVLPVESVLRMWTSGGARALLLQNRIGTLEAGKRADIILLSHQGPHITPTHSLLRTMAMWATPADVTDVIVDGTILMRARTLTQVDEAEIVAKASEHMQAIAQRAGF